jgi:TPP-dependent trihydroxycyclohexane-1,2-dione (THcHDO) dehydratase
MRAMKEDAEAMIADAITALEKIADELEQLETKAREQEVPFWD